MYERTMYKRIDNPNLKILLAIGGWNHGTASFSKAVATPTSMATFTENAIKFLRLHDFDGLDLDWEYPGSRGSGPGDKVKFTQLVKVTENKFIVY